MARMALAAALVAAAFLAVPPASASPPPGTECMNGYEPNALVNVCYKSSGGSGPGSVPVPGPSVGFSNTHVCIIGQTCVDVPTPQPGLGAPIAYVPTPGNPGVIDPRSLYIETDVGGIGGCGLNVFVTLGPQTFCLHKGDGASVCILETYEGEFVGETCYP